MRAYVATTGLIFAVVTILHLARGAEVWGHVADDPWFVVGYALLTLLAAVLAVWAWRLFRRLPANARDSAGR